MQGVLGRLEVRVGVWQLLEVVSLGRDLSRGWVTCNLLPGAPPISVAPLPNPAMPMVAKTSSLCFFASCLATFVSNLLFPVECTVSSPAKSEADLLAGTTYR